jgi:hypothetical protein
MDIFGQVAIMATEYALAKSISPVQAWHDVMGGIVA